MISRSRTLLVGHPRDTTVTQDGVQERFFIGRAMHRQACIIGGATTFQKATREGDSPLFVIKDSWQYVGKDEKRELLMDVAEAEVRNVAQCYHCATIRVGGKHDKLRSCVRKGVDFPSGRKWRLRKGRAGGPSSFPTSYYSIQSPSLMHFRPQSLMGS